ncbi:branched-chain amino acid ABC transporter permease [Nocardioides sp. MAH-18]|uniref:Branched-chain amino acid ABC transporter permease n=1 Tax=Nocardioides agri TaxID=2682843 RepID=A0A6L6XMY9_9ACTN|nr:MULTISPECIES: branched-chain amino acid ABC transporter permease [unclassified Nocardioides]MBA2953806.1 branched-chain amino acid ABC transporter permease [Nocardioides sp. CGMCC 1.13656]MVQ48671.1 branched-chain amino acid ABC transporter permease [Nocardioides sp. MAH-18]
MTLFLQLGFQGVALGMVYALIALGFVIMTKGSNTFNFAHGEFVAVGAYVVVALMPHLPYWMAFIGSVVVTVTLALVAERLLLRRLVSASPTALILATLALAVIVHALVLVVWGVGTKGSAGPVGSGTVEIGDVVLTYSGIATIGTSILVLLALLVFFRWTSYGLALRATASHQEAAAAQGIDVGRMFALSWGIAAALAVVASIFLASFPRIVSPTIGLVALAAIPAVVIGGLDSFVGAVVGGLVVGLIQVLGAGYLTDYGGGRLHEVLPYVLMLVVLVLRPYGLFGSRGIERV